MAVNVENARAMPQPARMNAQEIIRLLDLAPLEKEGGYFRRTWTSQHPDPEGRAGLNAASMIYYLIAAGGCSAMHRVRSDEHWLYHAGDPLEMLLLHPGGGSSVHTLGMAMEAGQRPQLTVPGGVWQGARPIPAQAGSGWTLVSAVVCPEFSWQDFDLADAGQLRAGWSEEEPNWSALLA